MQYKEKKAEFLKFEVRGLRGDADARRLNRVSRKDELRRMKAENP